ncbi:MAG: outer membrane lipoprotein-sorting protein [Nevskiales bacterium]
MRWFIALTLLGLSAGPAFALSPEEKAQEIIDEGERRAEGFKDMVASAEMLIRNARGHEARRGLDIKILEVPDGGRSLTVVQAPKDVRGTALLTFSYDHGEDEQWLFLPALKRVKRIAASGRSGPFMGSEFSYEDFSAQSRDKYVYRWLGEETLNGLDCHLIERLPKAATQSGYSRLLTWIEKKELLLQRVHYFDLRNQHIKTLNVTGYSQYQNRWWRAESFVMTNLVTGGASTLTWRDIKFSVGLTERDLDQNALQAAR